MKSETFSTAPPRRAMVLAAGKGVRMRPITDRIPKPMVRVGGRALIDHVLERLEQVDVEMVVVNVNYLAEKLIQHLSHRPWPKIVISDETEQLLDTGGGVVKALPSLG